MKRSPCFFTLVITLGLLLSSFIESGPVPGLLSMMDTTYIETPATLKTSTGDISGSLILPTGIDKGIVVLIIAGSGPTDRDGNNPAMKNNSLKMLAEGLAASGIASLRYDKRGIGRSAGAMKKEEDLRFEDYVNDARGWIELLRRDKHFKKIVILGHSEGSLIGILSASGADKFVSVAGPGQSADKIIKDQIRSQPQQVQDMTFPLIDSLKNGHKVTNPSPMLASLFRESVQPYLISWFAYDPQEQIKKITKPVLIIQGTNDLQVPVSEAKLLSGANEKATVALIDKMNHVLKLAEADRQSNLKTYNDSSLPLAPEFLKTVIAFILQ